MPDLERFQAACTAVIGAKRVQSGIGTLGEKSLHAILKRYYEPHMENHEIPVGRYVADIVGENGIIEIQTGQFGPLREKLAAFLEVCSVTVVHPVMGKRLLSWIDPETGKASELRRAPCKDIRADIFLELSRITNLLPHPNLSFCFPILEIEEYRFLNPKQKNPKRHFSRCDRIPTGLMEEWHFASLEDYRFFLPKELEKEFTSREFAKAAKCALSTAQVMLYVFNSLSLVSRVGKCGSSYLYEISK